MTYLKSLSISLLLSMVATHALSDASEPMPLSVTDTAPPQFTSDAKAPPALAATGEPPSMIATKGSVALEGEGNASGFVGQAAAKTFSLIGSPPPPAPEPVPVVTPVPPIVPEIVFRDTLFRYDSAVLDDPSHQDLINAAMIIRQKPGVVVELWGFTDVRGSSAYNMELSRQRSQSVKRALADLGVPSSRMIVVAKGESNPLRHGNSDADHQLNRRVEVHFR